MAKEPKEFGMGQLADGSIPVYTPQQAKKLMEQRDAEEANDEGADDISDLDSLDKIFDKK